MIKYKQKHGGVKMNWCYAEGKDKPATIDDISSKKWVYIRRDIVENERKIEPDSEIKEKFYRWEEMKVPKDIYDIFRGERDNSNRLNDIEEVLTEILGGEMQ
jgi:hypothetical protein